MCPLAGNVLIAQNACSRTYAKRPDYSVALDPITSD
jgi:hypothetical protein